jgi:fructokinase
MSSILCFGEALIDFHAQPQGGAGQPPAFVPFAGGAPANVAVAAALLGARARFAGMLARDMFGDFLLKSLTDLGVDVARTDEARTALAFVAHDENGDRSFSFYRPPAADLLFRPEHFRKEAFDDVAIFHVCSNSLTEGAIAETTVEGMRRARAAGALVSFDMNLRPALWPKGHEQDAQLGRLWQTLSEADVIKLSAEEFAVVHEGAGSDEAVLKRLWDGKARLLLITDGPAPMRWYTRNANGVIPGYKVEAVDTTAAGDAFVGGMLARLAAAGTTHADLDALVADEARLTDLIRFAAACGAITATRKGSFTAIPDQAEVKAFMEKHA